MSAPVNPNDAATLVPGTVTYFHAPVGTAIPVDLKAPGAAWRNFGHTALEDAFSVSTEGGEKTVLATAQNRTLRTKVSAKSDTFALKLQQFDTESLKLYYGSNAVDVVAGDLVGVPEKPVATTLAFLAVFLDDDDVFAIYAPKAEILGNEVIEAGDVEALASLPIGVTPLRYQTNTWLYGVTPLGDA